MNFRKELAKELGVGLIAEKTMMDEYVAACKKVAERYHTEQCNIDSVSGWLSFDTPPKAGQEILIVWETYPPEKRILTDEDLAKNWDGMRWLPIPAYR